MAAKPEQKPAAPVAAPATPAAAPAPAPAPKKQVSRGKVATARILGAAIAGISEIICFHPVDTCAKRLMKNEKKVFGGGFSKSMDAVSRVIFAKAYGKSAMTKFLSLYPGIGFGVAYKLLQRVYKFGGQPFVDDFLVKNYKKDFDRWFGKKWGRSVMFATAGSLIGIGEVVLLPLDVLKIKSQVNPEAFKGKGFMKIVVEENIGLYRGTLFTAARNAPGSFALFGGSALAKELMGIRDYNKATFLQTTLASTAGACTSILVSSPFDVIKTRIQGQGFEGKQTGLAIMSKMAFQEGPSSFFKGVIPKLAMIGPKLIFSMTIAQYMTVQIEKAFGVEGKKKGHGKH